MNITHQSIQSYLETLPLDQVQDVETLIHMMEKITGLKPKLWGQIVGFGHLHYRYPTGHEGEMPILAFARRINALTLYLSFDVEKLIGEHKLGKYTTGKSCLYLKSLKDVDLDVLNLLMKKAYDTSLNYDFITVIEA